MSFRNPFRNKQSSEPPLRSITSPVEPFSQRIVSTEYVALPQNAQASSEHCGDVYAQASEVTSDCTPIARLNSTTKQCNKLEAENRDLKLKVAQLERDLAIASNRNRELEDKQALDIAALKVSFLDFRSCVYTMLFYMQKLFYF